MSDLTYEGHLDGEPCYSEADPETHRCVDHDLLLATFYTD